ncbi:hypothetical protein NQZ79_g5188 [Umbelopsis isabellina]|nr:hypothetical protein NQZ79_g5188 [Umbelopsis isabellina]
MSLILTHLPTEVILTIFLYLDDASIAAVSSCNKYLADICSSEILWKRLCSPFGIRMKELSYRNIYQKLLAKYAWLLGVWQSDYTFYGGLLLVTLDRKSASIRGSLIQAQEHHPEPINTWSFDPGVIIVNPRIDLKGHELFRIDLKGGNPYVSIPSDTFHQDDIDVISCDFHEHDLCPYLWQSVRKPFVTESATSYGSDEQKSSRPTSGQKAFTFVFNQIASRSLTTQPKVPRTDIHYSATRLFSWMSNANARLDSSPRFVKLNSSVTRMHDPVELADFNTSIRKQLPIDTKGKASKEFPEGLFKCYYGSHGLEYLIVRHDPENHSLTCYKVTGDMNIPRSEISWMVPDTRYSLRICTEQEFDSAEAYEALGHVAYQGFTGDRMIPAECEFEFLNQTLI